LFELDDIECYDYAMQNKVIDVGIIRRLLDDSAKMATVDTDGIAAIVPVRGPLMMEAPGNSHPA
jgi:hypothetical protein